MPGRSGAWAASALIVLAAPGAAQKSKDDWQRDPYTKGEPAAMQRAGYVSFGPFPWGDDHDSQKIHEMMPEAKIRWVETAHFRIGSSLKTLPLPRESKSRRRFKKELAALKKRLPTVKTSARKLDPWLRLHLYAARLEALYAEVQAALGVTDADFPKERTAKLPMQRGADFMGLGPYLGMGDKYCVLLFKKASNLTRYSVKAGQPQPKDPVPISLNFLEKGCMLFGTCTEIVFHSEDPDHRLHAHLRFNISQQLLRGYRFYAHVLPAWIDEGVANSFVRSWDPLQHDFSGMKNWDHSKTYPLKWAVNCRRLDKNGFATPSARLCKIWSANELTFNDQMCAWSRVDYLRQIDGGKKFAQFLARMKAPMPHAPGKNPTRETILAAQEAALRDVFGVDFAAFDAGWSRYVRKTYPRK